MCFEIQPLLRPAKNYLCYRFECIKFIDKMQTLLNSSKKDYCKTKHKILHRNRFQAQATVARIL